MYLLHKKGIGTIVCSALKVVVIYTTWWKSLLLNLPSQHQRVFEEALNSGQTKWLQQTSLIEQRSMAEKMDCCLSVSAISRKQSVLEM